MRHLGTYKCQSELVGDQKLNKITFESQTQKLAKEQSKMNWLGSKTEQNHLKISDSEIGQKEVPGCCCRAIALCGGKKQRLPINVKSSF